MIVESIYEECGLYFRSVVLSEGTRIDQHTHDHDHANYCGSGAAEFWEDGKFLRAVRAGEVIKVRANRVHHFVALEDNTRLICVHNIESAESIKKKGL